MFTVCGELLSMAESRVSKGHRLQNSHLQLGKKKKGSHLGCTCACLVCRQFPQHLPCPQEKWTKFTGLLPTKVTSPVRMAEARIAGSGGCFSGTNYLLWSYMTYNPTCWGLLRNSAQGLHGCSQPTTKGSRQTLLTLRSHSDNF